MSELGSMQSLIISLKFPKFRLEDEVLVEQLFDLEDLIIDVIAESNAGYLEGNEFGEDTFTIFLNGLDADKLSESILPILQKLPPLPGSFLVKRFGDINAYEERMALFL